MYLIPENYEIVRHNNDENLNATCFQLTHHLHLMGILSSAVKMNPVRRSWEQILEETEGLEFEGNENFFVISLIKFFKNLEEDELNGVCEYIVATWLNNNPTILKQS